jgi:hypothetical protein
MRLVRLVWYFPLSFDFWLLLRQAFDTDRLATKVCRLSRLGTKSYQSHLTGTHSPSPFIFNNITKNTHGEI